LLTDWTYEFQGKNMDLCTEVGLLFDTENQSEFNLTIVPKYFDENSCNIHFHKLQLLVNEPRKFLTTVCIDSQYNFGKLDIFSTFSAKNPIDFEFNPFGANLGDDSSAGSKGKNGHGNGKAIDQKSNSSNGSQTKSKKKSHKMKLGLNQILCNSLLLFRKLSKDPLYNPMKRIKVEDPELLREVFMSGWNPAPYQRKICGDFFYVRVHTFEDRICHITAFAKGFYVNKSTDDNYDPTPNSKAYPSLPNLLDE
jgi:hypothetical protein